MESRPLLCPRWWWEGALALSCPDRQPCTGCGNPAAQLIGPVTSPAHEVFTCTLHTHGWKVVFIRQVSLLFLAERFPSPILDLRTLSPKKGKWKICDPLQVRVWVRNYNSTSSTSPGPKGGDGCHLISMETPPSSFSTLEPGQANY